MKNLFNIDNFNKEIEEILKSKEILESREKIKSIIYKKRKITKKIESQLDSNVGINVKLGNFSYNVFIREEDNEIILLENLEYMNENGSFLINFYNDDKKINQLEIKLFKVDNSIAFSIFLMDKLFVNKLIINKYEDKEVVFENDKCKSFLSEINEENITKLDSKEYKDLFKLISDFDINLKEFSSYADFKKYFKIFCEELVSKNNPNKKLKI